MGLAVDPSRRRLGVCAVLVDGSAAGELWLFDLDDGSDQGVVSLDPISPTASCTDIAFGNDGAGYVTDRENGAMYLVDPEEGGVTLFSDHPALEPDLIGSNGVALTEDGEYLLVSKYLAPELVRVSLADPSDTVTVSLRGDTFASGGPFRRHGGDVAPPEARGEEGPRLRIERGALGVPGPAAERVLGGEGLHLHPRNTSTSSPLLT